MWSTKTSELERLESDPHPYSPTIGIEIEIPGHTLLTRAEKVLSKRVKKAYIEHREKSLEGLVDAGFTRDETDPWWEFALQPSNSYLTQIAELEALEEAGAIDLENNYYSIHVNLGGITTKGSTGGEAFVIARALEATTWASSGRRLLMPFERRADSWTCGTGGVYERSSEELQVDGPVIEIRTFMAHGKNNMLKTLEASYYMAACLSAFQNLNNEYSQDASRNPLSRSKVNVKDPFIREGADLNDSVKLSAIWSWFSEEINNLFRKYNISDPSKPWQEPINKWMYKKTKGDFEALARAMETQPDFAEEAQGLVEILIYNTKEIID